MDFTNAQMSFFISTVSSSALSLGFSTSDASSLASTLNTLFNFRCSPPISVPGINAPAELQSICIAADCPLDPNADCGAYPDEGVAKVPVNVTVVAANGTSTTSSAVPTGTGNGTVAASLGVGGKQMFGLQVVGVVVGAVVVALSML